MNRRQLAIDGGPPIREESWPPPHVITHLDEKALLTALHQPNWSHGAQANEFQAKFGEFCGTRFAILVPNGTSAVKLALLAAGVGIGDEVIIPGVTWPSVAAAVMECGAVPVAADISFRTYCLTQDSIRQKLTERTRAVIPTHLFCSQVDMPPVIELAREFNLVVIEDAAQAVGTRRHGRAAGTWAHFGVFSFNQRKLLACGEGGCLVTDDPDLFARAQEVHMIDPARLSTPCRTPFTYKVSEFQAAIALSQLQGLQGQLALIEQNAALLTEKLRRLGNVSVLERLEGTEVQSYYNFCADISDVPNIAWFRRALAAELKLEISPVYLPLSEVMDLKTTSSVEKRFISRIDERLPNCHAIYHNRSLRFPHFALRARTKDIQDIADAFEKVMDSVVKFG